MDLFCCDMCSITRNLINHLIAHVNKEHKNELNFIFSCKYGDCGYTTRSYQGWKNHNSRKHAQPKENLVTNALGAEMWAENILMQEESGFNIENEFKFSVAKYLLRLKTMKKLTSDAINLVVENTVDLISRKLAVYNIQENNIEMITKTFGSDYMRYMYYKSHCGFVQPKEVILGKRWVAYKERYKQVNDTCYCVPFLDLLKSTLQLPEMTDFILHRIEHNDGIL